MDRNNHESNPGMIERQLDESPMEGRSSSDMELDRDHLQRTDRPVEREGMQGGSVERDSMRGEDTEREGMQGEGMERDSMRGDGMERESTHGEGTTPARDW